MSASALLRLIDTSCCGLRKSKTDKRSEEREIEETQGLLKHDDLDSEVESLDCAWAQGPLLQVEAYDDCGLQVLGRIQDDGDVRGERRLKEKRVIQDDGAVRDDGGGQDNTELLVLEDDEERHNTGLQKLDSLDCTVLGSESIELEDLVQNALLYQDDLDIHTTVSHAVEVETPITPPKTIITLDGLLENGLELTEHNAKQVLDPVNVAKTNKLGLVSLLTGNKEICDRIMSLLFPGDSITICEYPECQEFEWRHVDQIRYSLTDDESINNTRWTACFAMQNPEAPDLARIVTKKRFCDSSPPFCNFSPHILGTSKILYSLGSLYLYRRNFRFQCSAKRAKKFLLEKAVHARSITQINLFYHFEGEPLVIETGNKEWHDMLSTMRHDLSFIPKIHVHVGHGFWSKTNWRWGPKGVINDSVFRDDGRYLPLVMYDVARFAAPAERWKDHKDPATLCTAGTLVRVSIEGEKMTGEETWKVNEKIRRVEFVEQLNDEVLRQGLARPLHPGGRSRSPYTRPYVPR
jgi:hypothetical protein